MLDLLLYHVNTQTPPANINIGECEPMAIRKKTLRKMSPTTRKYAKLVNELESVHTRLKNMIPEIASLEADSRALMQHRCQTLAERAMWEATLEGAKDASL